MKGVLAIMAHAAASETVEQFLPQWEKLGLPIRFFVPSGQSLEATKDITCDGEDSRTGDAVLNRFQSMLLSLWETDFDFFVIAEYDTLNLTERLPEFDLGYLNCGLVHLVHEDNSGNKIPLPQFCALSPWIVSRPMLSALIEAIRLELVNGEEEWAQGLLDRRIGSACHRFGVAMKNMPKVCPFPWVDGIHNAIRIQGKTWVHGWKHKDEFKTLWPLSSQS